MKKKIIALVLFASASPMLSSPVFAKSAGIAVAAVDASAVAFVADAGDADLIGGASADSQAAPLMPSFERASPASSVTGDPLYNIFVPATASVTSADGVMMIGGGAASSALMQDGSRISGAVAATRDPSYTVTLNQDSFFGFYPAFNGLIPVDDKMDFSFYGIFWTKPAFGLGQGNTGDDLWTEFGVGVNFNLADGRLKIKPQIGITNGSLLSGGSIAGGNTAGARFLDGIVPSLTVNYSDDKIEAEYYGGYYAALRQRDGNAALDFLHTWVNVGYKVSSTVSFGPHYELLYNSRNTYPGGRANTTYEWLGGYVQIALAKGFFARFTGGTDLDDDNAGDFYKMSVGMSF